MPLKEHLGHGLVFIMGVCSALGLDRLRFVLPPSKHSPDHSATEHILEFSCYVGPGRRWDRRPTVTETHECDKQPLHTGRDRVCGLLWLGHLALAWSLGQREEFCEVSTSKSERLCNSSLGQVGSAHVNFKMVRRTVSNNALDMPVSQASSRLSASSSLWFAIACNVRALSSLCGE
eukprot:1085158-Amphidinium_carterae.1